MNPNINRALIFQGGGSLDAYEAGVYKADHEDISEYFRTEGREMSQYFISYLKRQ
jgi:NTE family protein